MSNHKFAQLAVALLVAHTCQIVHAGPPGVGGATEFTQIMNNSELLKIGADGAMTSINTTNQYLTQLQQYRNQLLNTVGMDPSLLNSRLNSLDQSYQQVTNYRNLLTRTQGSIGTQIDAWTTRYDAARLSNRSARRVWVNRKWSLAFCAQCGGCGLIHCKSLWIENHCSWWKPCPR